MKLIDMHCDTLMKLLADEKANLKNGPFQINLDRLKQAGSLVQFFACFTNLNDYALPQKDAYDKCYETVLKMIARLNREIDKNPLDLALAANFSQILENEKNHKISAFLTVEEGGILNGHIERLNALYQKGVRLITLTWNYENSLACPNSDRPEIMAQGLKPFGLEVLHRMNELGMIIDVSHLSDQGFWDVIKHSRYPITASHSCVRDLCPHTRNLTAEMLRAIGENGGVVGLNFHGGFLRQNGSATVRNMTEHIRFIVDTAGIEAAAIGSDFDGGISGNLDISHIGKIPLLYEALKKADFTDEDIEKIFYKNALRVIRDSVK